MSRAQIGGGGQFFFGSKVRVTNSIFLEINNAEIVTDHGEQRVRDAGVTYTAALKRSCAEVRNAMVAVKKEVGVEEWEKGYLQRSIQEWKLREKLDHKGGSDE